jgi:hypothetical protein
MSFKLWGKSKLCRALCHKSTTDKRPCVFLVGFDWRIHVPRVQHDRNTFTHDPENICAGCLFKKASDERNGQFEKDGKVTRFVYPN